MILETPQDRVILLRTGFTGRQIEELYIACNNFKIVSTPAIFELIVSDVQQNRNNSIRQEATAELSL